MKQAEPTHRGADRLSAIARIVVACSRARLTDEARRQIIAAVHCGVDWAQLCDLAEGHGVGYFVATHFVELAQSDRNFKIDQQWLRQCRRWQHQIAARGLLLLDRQQRITATCERAGVPIVWLKGLALSEELYGRFDARASVDLDLLTEPAQFPAVALCLTRLGFVRFRDSQPGKDRHFLSAHHQRWHCAVTENWQMPLELHHQVSGPAPCRPPARDILDRARHINLGGQAMRTPALEDELLLLCLHAHHHNYGILRGLMDVAEFVRRFGHTLDWPRFLATAQRYHAVGCVQATCLLAKAALGPLEVNPAVGNLTELQRLCVRPLSMEALLDPRGEQDDVRRVRLALLMDRWRDVIALLAPHVWPSRDYLQDLSPQHWRRIPGGSRAYHLCRLIRRTLVRAPVGTG